MFGGGLGNAAAIVLCSDQHATLPSPIRGMAVCWFSVNPSKTSTFKVRVYKGLHLRPFTRFLKMHRSIYRTPARASFHTSFWPKRSGGRGRFHTKPTISSDWLPRDIHV